MTLREVRGRQERPHFEHQHELKSGSDTHAVQRVTVNRQTKEAPKIHNVTGNGEKIEMIRAAAVGLRSSFCQLPKTCFLTPSTHTDALAEREEGVEAFDTEREVAYSIFIFRFVLVQMFLITSTGNKVALGEIRTAATRWPRRHS